MTLEQLYICAVALDEAAETTYNLRQYERKNLAALKDKYDDLTKMTEDDKRTADKYEERIREHYKKEKAYNTLSDAIKDKDIYLNLNT